MRVLHLLAERGFSGGEHQLLHVLRHFRDHGHDSVLVLNRNARFRSSAEELGLEVHEVPMRHDGDLVAVFRLRRLIRRLAPDLLHFGCSRSHKLGALASARLRGCPPRVVTRRMDYPIKRSAFRRWLYGRAVDAIVVVSEGVRVEVLKTGVDAAKVHLIHDGVDTEALGRAARPERRAAARRALGLPDDTVCGVTTASMHWRKGHDVLLEALRTIGLTEPNRRVLWLMAGDGPTRMGLEEVAATMPASIEIRFLGQTENVLDLLAAADVFCLPSRKEGLGVALLEAMAVGLPTVASAVGGILEAVAPDRTGLLVPPENPQALGAALRRIINEPELAQELGAAARQRTVERFDVRRMSARTEELYACLAAGGSKPAGGLH